MPTLAQDKTIFFLDQGLKIVELGCSRDYFRPSQIFKNNFISIVGKTNFEFIHNNY